MGKAFGVGEGRINMDKEKVYEEERTSERARAKYWETAEKCVFHAAKARDPDLKRLAFLDSIKCNLGLRVVVLNEIVAAAAPIAAYAE